MDTSRFKEIVEESLAALREHWGVEGWLRGRALLCCRRLVHLLNRRSRFQGGEPLTYGQSRFDTSTAIPRTDSMYPILAAHAGLLGRCEDCKSAQPIPRSKLDLTSL